MQTYGIYLYPKSTFLSLPTSDTLFGAICWAIYHLWNEKKLEDILKDFTNQRPRFILSSTFPYLVQNKCKVRFFPKPLFPQPTSQQLAKKGMKDEIGTDDLNYKRGSVKIVERLKEIKKAPFISESLFSQLVEGRLDLKGIYPRFKKKGAIPEDIEKIGNSLITYEEREKIDPEGKLENLVKEIDIQRNQVDRVVGSTVEGLLFSNKEISCKGLWFLVQTDDLDFLKTVFPCVISCSKHKCLINFIKHAGWLRSPGLNRLDLHGGHPQAALEAATRLYISITCRSNIGNY